MGIYSSYPPWFLGLRFVGALCCFCPNATTLYSELWPPFKIMEHNHKLKYKCEENAKEMQFLRWQRWPSCLVNEVNVKRSWTQWNISATGKFQLLHISRSSFYSIKNSSHCPINAPGPSAGVLGLVFRCDEGYIRNIFMIDCKMIENFSQRCYSLNKIDKYKFSSRQKKQCVSFSTR